MPYLAALGGMTHGKPHAHLEGGTFSIVTWLARNQSAVSSQHAYVTLINQHVLMTVEAPSGTEIKQHTNSLPHSARPSIGIHTRLSPALSKSSCTFLNGSIQPLMMAGLHCTPVGTIMTEFTALLWAGISSPIMDSCMLAPKH